MSRFPNVIATLYEQRSPDSALFRSIDGSVITTREAKTAVIRLGKVLRSLGVCAGDRVSVRVAKSPEAILLAHACLWIGAILHPLNNSYTKHELTTLLADASPRLFLTTSDEMSELRPLADEIGTRIEPFSTSIDSLDVEEAVDADAISPPEPYGAAVILYTSGTTGKPKGALITHENLLTSAKSLAQVWRIRSSDILLHALPIYHAHGLLTSINAVMAGGGSVLLLPTFEQKAVCAALGKATIMMGVPTHYARLVEAPIFAESIGPDFRLAISGSAPLASNIAESFKELFGVPIIERYGSTEAAIIAAVPPEAQDRLGWVGWPLSDVKIRVSTKDGPSFQGVGTIETRGPNVFAGYWRNREATDEAFTSDGWFKTGDLGEIDATGCLRLLGREKDVVISGGLNVYPAEVEAEIRRLEGVKDTAVFGAPHPEFGEAVVAAIEYAKAEDFDEAALIERLRARLAGYKTPKKMILVTEIPRNAMGKVLKASLRDTFSELFSTKH